MPGKIQFDRDEVVQVAMRLFWRNGYRHTTMRDLTEATGVRESSLYNSFGDKQGLYKAVLKAYQKQFQANMGACIDPESPLQTIKNFWSRMAYVATHPDRAQGCLYLNVAVERGHNDTKHAEAARLAYQSIEDQFHTLIMAAQEKGEIDKDRDSRKLARFLTHSMQGLMVAMFTNPDKDFINDAVEVALSVLD